MTLICTALLSSTLLLGFQAAGNTAASPTTASPLQAANPAVAPEERINCRSVRYTGSRFPVRECSTKAERDARAVRAQGDKERNFIRGRGRQEGSRP